MKIGNIQITPPAPIIKAPWLAHYISNHRLSPIDIINSVLCAPYATDFYRTDDGYLNRTTIEVRFKWPDAGALECASVVTDVKLNIGIGTGAPAVQLKSVHYWPHVTAMDGDKPLIMLDGDAVERKLEALVSPTLARMVHLWLHALRNRMPKELQ